mgnify:CR=1 FL=1
MFSVSWLTHSLSEKTRVVFLQFVNNTDSACLAALAHSRVLRFGYLPLSDIPLSEGVLRTPRLQNTTRTNQYFEWALLRQKQSYRCFKMN